MICFPCTARHACSSTNAGTRRRKGPPWQEGSTQASVHFLGLCQGACHEGESRRGGGVRGQGGEAPGTHPP